MVPIRKFPLGKVREIELAQSTNTTIPLVHFGTIPGVGFHQPSVHSMAAVFRTNLGWRRKEACGGKGRAVCRTHRGVLLVARMAGLQHHQHCDS
jgi:hypothetical protein